MSDASGFVNYFERHKLHLIRIAKTGEDAGKRPNDTGWQKTPLSYGAARLWSESGGNLGWAVGANYLVLDIDPRNGGNESYDHLLADLDLDLDPGQIVTTTPVVVTGGGGRHIYLSRDPSLGIRPGPLRGYPGIDIKTGASQVVIPGSTHPCGLPYLPDGNSNWPAPPQPAPAPLLNLLIQRTRAPAPASTAANATALHDCITLDQCDALLEHNDPAKLESYERWISRLAAIHHATGGKGLELAIKWSARDPKYSSVAESQVVRRWRSFDAPHDFPATVQTLLADVRSIPAAYSITTEISQEMARAEFDDESRLDDELTARVDALPGGGWKANKVEIEQIIEESLSLNSITRDNLIRRLAKETKTPYGALNRYVNRTQKEQEGKKDKIPMFKFVEQVRDRTIRKIKESGEHIVRAPNEQYYIYNGRYWVPHNREHVTALVHHTVKELMDANSDLSFETTGITDKAEKSLRAEVHTKKTHIYNRQDPISVINTKNGTIWIDDRTGEHEIKPHYAGDYLTTQIDTPYDPDATCPSFDVMLEQVFEHVTSDLQRAELIRHFWELVGYVIQPHKNIPLIMLWYGTGLNGKTTIAQFISDLVGKMCAQPVDMHELGSGRNNHAFESLEGKLILIDDDLRSDARLSDSVLKKFSESKLMSINPKYQKSYSARVDVTPVILTNGYPVIRDLSKGLQRRMDVMPFEGDLTKHKGSNLPHIARTQEMSGILNRALDGLKRLRARKAFSRPQCSLDASAAFFSESNNVAAFINFNTCPGGGCALSPLYVAYTQFCISGGERLHMERLTRFRAMVSQLGYEIEHNIVKGIKLASDQDEEFVY